MLKIKKSHVSVAFFVASIALLKDFCVAFVWFGIELALLS